MDNDNGILLALDTLVASIQLENNKRITETRDPYKLREIVREEQRIMNDVYRLRRRLAK